MQEGLLVTLVGLAVVFVTLWVLSGVLSAMKLFSGVENKRKEELKVQVADNSTEEEEAVVEEGAEAAGDDLQLVAVISAAIAMATGSGLGSFRIVNIRQVPLIRRTVSTESGWAAAARQDVIGSHL